MKNKQIQKLTAPDFQVNEGVSLEEQIAQRAHELWQQGGRRHGGELADWLHAEREVNAWHQQRLRAQAARQERRPSS